MARKRYKPEEIIAKLRQVDVLVSQGQNIVDAIRMTFSARCSQAANQVTHLINLAATLRSRQCGSRAHSRLYWESQC
jgi:hypothetical protein